MSCETHAASSVFRDTSTNLFLSQGLPPSLSGSGRLGLAISSGFDSSLGPGLQESGGHSSFHSDASSGDHVRITMKTRVAVRDKKSHRFQVIPLRDITKDTLSQAELSGQLMVPNTNTPANYLCTPSRKVVSYSQSKSLYSSASAQSLGTVNGKENRLSEAAAGKGFNSRTLDSFDSKTSLSSLTPSPVERNTVLVEFDLNREDTKPASLPHLPSNRTTQEKAPVLLNLPLQDSNRNPFDSAANTHTTSQSLHIQKRYKNDASKFASLGHFSSKLDVDSKASLERLSYDEVREAKFSCSANERSKKRHAMRTPPLFLPYFERLASSTGPANPDEEQVLQETIGDEKAEFEQNATSNIIQIDNDRTISPEFHYFDACLDDQAMPRRILEDPFIDSSGLIDFQPIDSPLHHSSPKSGRSSSRLRLSPNCQTIRRVQRNDIRCPGGIVYPKTVLDLFLELDKAIESWSPHNM